MTFLPQRPLTRTTERFKLTPLLTPESGRIRRWSLCAPLGQAERIGGVIGAALRVLPHFKEEWIETSFYAHDAVSQSVSALVFAGLCLYVWFGSLKNPRSQVR